MPHDLSNYPPGVSGNEPQIAGYPEPDDDDLDFARDTLGPDASDDDVYDLAVTRMDRDRIERDPSLGQ